VRVTALSVLGREASRPRRSAPARESDVIDKIASSARARVDSGEVVAQRAVPNWALVHGQRLFPLVEPVCFIGRGDDVHLQLSDIGVSRRHAALHSVVAQLFIEDLRSCNGTYVNGQRISHPIELLCGDEVQIGPCELRVSLRSSRRERAECTTQPIPPIPRSPQSALLATLSPRERELLPLLAGGLSQRELSAQLGVTVKTIETYRTRIGHKLGVSNRAGLIRFALDNGLLSSE
jgi:DNA-binding CsgD family transcriptional regulator